MTFLFYIDLLPLVHNFVFSLGVHNCCQTLKEMLKGHLWKVERFSTMFAFPETGFSSHRNDLGINASWKVTPIMRGRLLGVFRWLRHDIIHWLVLGLIPSITSSNATRSDFVKPFVHVKLSVIWLILWLVVVNKMMRCVPI